MAGNGNITRCGLGLSNLATKKQLKSFSRRSTRSKLPIWRYVGGAQPLQGTAKVLRLSSEPIGSGNRRVIAPNGVENLLRHARLDCMLSCPLEPGEELATGTVKFFNSEKRFDFITPHLHPDVIGTSLTVNVLCSHASQQRFTML